MENMKSVPKATLQRYPIYLKALRQLKGLGIERVMSSELSDYVGIKSTTIRRDLSFLGTLGKQGFGYEVDVLIDIFNEKLGIDFDEKIILVGAGNLGRALMNYNRWNYVVGEIVCAFDIDPAKCTNQYSIPVYPLDEMEQRLPEGCRIAIVTASKDIQKTVNRLSKMGIKGIVDFTHEHIIVPKGVILKPVDVVSTIQELVFETNSMTK
ncbi:MAG: redox-sensing transcriptional repressor Rex [Erysipelotrichaceae bacterium]|nr:redox-sensing transcriptional repressor Rex [Erysipelotrichaceae bacterium]